MIPYFRYLSDIEKYLDNVEQQVSDLINIIKSQKSLYKQIYKSTAESIKAYYAIVDELYGISNDLEAVSMLLKTDFKDTQKESLRNRLKFLQVKVSKEIRETLNYLSSQSSVPAKFSVYVEKIAEEVRARVPFSKSKVEFFTYVIKNSLAFSAYIWVYGASNKKGEVIDQFYICVNFAKNIKISLGYDWNSPESLYYNSCVCTNKLSESIKAVETLLLSEQFNIL